MILEGHCSPVGAKETCLVRTPALDYEYEVEAWTDVIVERCPELRRLYCFWKGEVEVVWAGDGTDTLKYVGRTRRYRMRAGIPHLYPGRMGVATLVLGKDVQHLAEASKQAERLLKGQAGTVVLLNGDGVLHAWEKNSAGIVVMARREPLKPPALEHNDE